MDGIKINIIHTLFQDKKKEIPKDFILCKNLDQEWSVLKISIEHTWDPIYCLGNFDILDVETFMVKDIFEKYFKKHNI